MESESEDNVILFVPSNYNSVTVQKNGEEIYGADGDYLIKILDYNNHVDNNILINIDKDFFSEDKQNKILQIFCIILSVILGGLSALPMTIYQGKYSNQTLTEFVICILRGIFGWIVFSNEWHELMVIPKKCESIIKNIILLICASLYALPISWYYVIKYDPYPKILIYITIFFHFVALVSIFKYRSQKQFPKRSTNKTILIKQNILLSANKRALFITRKSSKTVKKIYTSIINNKTDKSFLFSLLFAYNKDATFYKNDKDTFTLKYEEDNYDLYGSIKSNITNIFLGICMILLLFSLFDEYHIILMLSFEHDSHQKILVWISIIFSIINSAIFIIITYNIHHKNIRQICKIFNIDILFLNILNFICHIPFIMIGMLLSLYRFQIAFTTFSKIVALLQLDYYVGYFVIWVCTLVPFLIESAFMIKALIVALIKIRSKFVLSCLFPNYFEQYKMKIFVETKIKEVPEFIRNLDDEMIDKLMEKIMLQ